MKQEKLTVIDGETLADLRLPPTRFCVQTLLPQGVSILGGAPKVGKSWLVLDLCVRVARGEPLWGLPTVQGTTLYLCLEDTVRRVQERLLQVTDEPPGSAFFAVAARTLADGLADQIRQFVSEHPDTLLVAVDTFQMVRRSESEANYANDYREVQILKQLADELRIALLLVHHLRKQGDSDPLNKLSGTTGLSGAVDAVFVLDRSRRHSDSATLVCTGRDIAYREIELRFSGEEHRWELVADSLQTPDLLLPPEMVALVEWTKEIGSFSGANSDLAQQFSTYIGAEISAKMLKQMMNRWRYLLEDRGVIFHSYRSNGQRLVKISFSVVPSDASDAEDVGIGCAQTCGPCIPCDPAADAQPAEEGAVGAGDADSSLLGGQASRRLYAMHSFGALPRTWPTRGPHGIKIPWGEEEQQNE